MNIHTINEKLGRIRTNWQPICLVAGLAIGLAGLETIGTAYSIPALIFPALMFTGISTLALVLAAAITGKCIVKRSTEYEFRTMRRKDIDDTIKLTYELLGQNVSRNAIKAVLSANRKCFTLMERVVVSGNKHIREVIGFYSIIPINKTASDLLDKEQLSGIRFDGTHVCAEGVKPDAYYIGSVAAIDNAYAQGIVLAHALGSLNQIKLLNKVRRVYTRPVTAAGLIAARKKGFKPVSASAGENELMRIYRCSALRGSV